MNKTLKKVLSYIGIALLGFASGVGCLIGVSSCSQKQDQTQINKQVYKKQQYFGYDLDNLYVIKSLAEVSAQYTSLEGVTLLPSIYNQSQPLKTYYEVKGNISYIGSNEEFSFQFCLLWDNYKIKLDYALLTNSTNTFYIYRNGAIENDCVLVINPTYVYYYSPKYIELESVYTIFNLYFNKFDSGNLMIFNFAKQINYYAPYFSDISNYYVYDANMGASGQSKVFTYNLPTFVSGGFVFNQIKVYYYNAISTSYIDDDGSRKVWSTNMFATYSDIQYINTITNSVQVVNKRTLIPYNDNGATGYTQGKGSYWLSNDFQELIFTRELTPQERLDLNQFNNNQYGDSFSVIDNNDIGLSNVFTLLSTAFSSWIPILSIQIIPGITIGLLLFLPLITGIIVLIIWIVKR